MTNAEAEFERKLDLFRTECEAAAQFFFGFMAIHEVAKRRRGMLDRSKCHRAVD